MVAHRLKDPGPGRGAADPHSEVSRPRRRSPWLGHLSVCALGMLGVLYLLLVWRAAGLDAQVAVVEERLAAVEFEHLRAKRLLADVLPQAAPIGDITAPGPPSAPEAMRCPALPPVEPSALSALAGSTTPGGAPASPPPPVAPPHGRMAHRTDLP